MPLVLFLILLLVVPISTARADDCESPLDQPTMNECADRAYKETDAKLNALYKQIKERLQSDSDTIQLLIAAQRAWLTYRDTECKFSTSSVSGGSVYPSIYADCADRLTKERVEDFKAYPSCQEGDLSCPVPDE